MDWIDGLMGKLLNLPPLGTREGESMDRLLNATHVSMVVLFAIWFAFLVVALVRFRTKRHPRANATGVSPMIFLLVIGMVLLDELGTLFGAAIPLWNKHLAGFPAEKDATVVRVAAQQFTWNVRYPGADGKFGGQGMSFVDDDNPLGYDPADPAGKDDVSPPLKDLRVPLIPIDVDGDGRQDLDEEGKPKFKPVLIHLSSLDVIHSLKILPFRICQDAIPGMSIPVYFTPTKTGKFMITCAQLCGNGHATMVGWLTVMEPEEYARWQANYLVDKSAARG